ncbi:peptidyl-prolyl cis-trans isomerase FKBP53 [Ipomoea triloba]|uniref:peptidyl-prolyl cis-trans isomerase FKBP53 n=1 Tax=Ipomoea triloba TaxID=35885 RepID=UPI00125E7143|nr:peptidyl-prolyl cis-trans isomerase FKBP53 [Ipomoea triloba]
MAFWGVELKPGKPYTHRFNGDRGRLHVSQATLGTGSSNKKSIVQCVVGDKKPIYLCNLLPERLETCALNLEFEEEDEVTFSVKGHHHVHLSGFFLGESQDDDGDEYEFDPYEGGFVEGDSDEDDSIDYDFEGEDDEDDSDDDLDMYPHSPVPNSGVKIEEIVEDKKPADESDLSKRPKKKKNQPSKGHENSDKQIVVKSNNSVPVLESEDEDGFPISTSPKSNSDAVTNKLKSQENEDHETDQKVQKGKRKIDAVDQTSGSENAKQKKKNKKKMVPDREDADLDDKEHAPAAETENNEKPTNEVETEKKKKKKNKKKQDSGAAIDVQQSGGKEIKSPMAVEEKADIKPSQVRTYPNGLIIEELSMGKPDGKRASGGKKVSVRYIGKLKKNGKIFDSTVGKAPFKFRLGIGQVIKGWDVGVEGMRVGDKRRLTIPPAMGYGAKGAGGVIPPNAWLVFDVELVDVN